ncbi:MAG TPA: MmcQ/YjbR family DNA-binding protein [Terriglobales bacterium]|nr:MmcQ/YjbR family DNA-binding protein [Terriglobales bacterium]
MRVSDFRRIALSLPEAVEGSHFGNADFRVGGKIFATLSLAKQGYGVLLLAPAQQQGMVEDEPEIFSAVPNGWGSHGATRVPLAKVSPDILKAALQTAWQKRAPKTALKDSIQIAKSQPTRRKKNSSKS